jgi:hypothetical protein
VSSLYLYAIAAEPRGEIPLEGLGGKRVSFWRCDDIVAAASEVEAPPEPTVPALRAHHEVVERLGSSASALLPVRFGCVLADAAELTRTLRSRREAIQRALRRVRGCVQMTLRIYLRPVEGAEPSGQGPGTRYLCARAHGGAALAPLRDALCELVRGEREEQDGRLFSVHHLVPRDAVERYRAAVDAFQGGGMKIHTSGPWAPYAFAREEAW